MPTNAPWLPVVAVHPDGTRLFAAWYDRRDDQNNGLIHLYGRWGTIGGDGSVTWATTDFRLTTTNFPPVFAGTLSGSPYTDPGGYDPVYPAAQVNLHWWYPEWPLAGELGDPILTDRAPHGYIAHVGEYNGVFSIGVSVYVSWTDYRGRTDGTLQIRNQPDIRLVRLTWP